MDLQKTRYAEKTHKQSAEKRTMAAAKASSTEDVCCANCGASIPRGNRFCEECGAPVGLECPHCHEVLTEAFEICPHCGHPVEPARCTFCGSSMTPGENFCEECGNPRHGITCPDCGTLNFRNFCRKCNRPLNEQANAQIERVRNDARVRKAQMLAAELEELEEEVQAILAEQGQDQGEDNAETKLSQSDLETLEAYKRLFGDQVVSPAENKPKPIATPKVKPATAKPDLKAAVARYKAKAKEMHDILDDLIPDPADPPIAQRDFLSACKVVTCSTVKRKERVNIGWVCNLCGCHHKQPSECARPELGGRWLYKDIEVVEKNYTNNEVYI